MYRIVEVRKDDRYYLTEQWLIKRFGIANWDARKTTRKTIKIFTNII